MKKIDEKEKVLKQLRNKKERIEKVRWSEFPKNDKLKGAHERRTENADQFLKELEEVEELLRWDVPIKLVPLPTFNKQVEKADFATLEYDGEYCKIAVLESYLSSTVYMVYVAPVEVL